MRAGELEGEEQRKMGIEMIMVCMDNEDLFVSYKLSEEAVCMATQSKLDKSVKREYPLWQTNLLVQAFKITSVSYFSAAS